MNVRPDKLLGLVTAAFRAAGCANDEAERVGAHLVDANLAGHDSHGVIRTGTYLRWLREGKVLAGRTIQTVVETESLAVVDGQFGFGQTVGAQAVRLGIEKAGRHGAAVVALRNAGHLGRIGAWPEQAAAAGLVSVHFVNTTGAGILVAPHGGTARRLSANPIAAGAPRPGRSPLVLDMSTCTIAEGKIRVARNRGHQVPPGCIIDSAGRPTTDPADFYADPPGAILPVAGHKGYGLGVLAEVLAGALGGGGCSNPANANRLANGMLSIYLNPNAFRPDGGFAAEIERFVEWVKSSPTVVGGEVLMPGELEERTRAARGRDGIEVEPATWSELLAAAAEAGLKPEEIRGLTG